MIQLIVGELFNLSVISSVWIIILLISQKTFLRKYTKEFNYSIWLLILLRMLFPYQYKVDISAYFDFYNTTYTRFYNILELCKRIKEFVYSICSIREIGYIWLAGVIGLTLYKFIYYHSARKNILNMSNKVTEENILSIYKEILNELSIKQYIELRRSNYNSVPFGIGVIKRYVILPDIIYTEKELRWILRHELTHFKYHDISYKLLMMVVSTLYWFDPFIYIVNKIINNCSELACDERVLNGFGLAERQEYAITILESITRSRNDKLKIAATLGKKSCIKVRVETMFQETPRRGIAIKVAILLLIFVSIINFSIGFGKYSDNIEKIRQNSIFYLENIDKNSK